MIKLDQVEAGLKNDEFFLEFMPTIRLRDKACVGAEALIRWKKDDRIISPMDFIPLVENTPLSGELTYWVIRQIGLELGNWLHEYDDIHLGINIPPEIIGRGGIKQAAEKAGLMDVTGKLIMEITERGTPDQIGIDALGSVRGLNIAVDDFGTGDFNLIDLTRLEVNVIKIDKAFVDEITDKDTVPKMIRGLVALAREFGALIIAEGIETPVQVSVLKGLNVDMGQGWFFSKPLPSQVFLNRYFGRV